jgi:hypothetical protein
MTQVLSEPRGTRFAFREHVLVKIVVAALVGALSGMFAASGVPWAAAPGAQTISGATTVARVEAAWHALRQHRAP